MSRSLIPGSKPGELASSDLFTVVKSALGTLAAAALAAGAVAALDSSIAEIVPDFKERGAIDATLAVLLTTVLDAIRKAVKQWLTDTRMVGLLVALTLSLAGPGDFLGGEFMGVGVSHALAQQIPTATTVAMPTPGSGKSVGVVTSTVAGKWIVLAADFQPISPLVLEEGKVCIFEGTAGRYAVFLIPPGDEQPAISIVELGGYVPPPPQPPGPGPNPPGPNPPGPVPPTPEVPADEFDNVGRATFQLVRGFPAEALGRAGDTAALYRRIADALESAGPLAPNINAVSVGVGQAYLQAERTKLWGPQASVWQAMVDAHQPVITKYKPDKPAYIKFLRAVAGGIEAAK